MVDLLVSLAVMVVLVSILMPSLMGAHEAARRVRCSSNVRQIGIAIQAYANDYRDRLPPAVYGDPEDLYGTANRSTATSDSTGEQFISDTMFARVIAPSYRSGPAPTWDGLGVLMRDGYLNHPGVFYCPSHHGEHPFSVYADQWVGGSDNIAVNYQYRVPAVSHYLSELDQRTSISADGMRTRSDYNHENGNNFLRADLSVGWFADQDGSLLNSLPETPLQPTQTSGWNHHPAWEFFDSVRE